QRAVSLNLQPGLIDDLLVHGDFARDARPKSIRSLSHHGQPGLDEFRANIIAAEDHGELLDQARDDRLRGTGWRVDALKGIGHGIPYPELLERGHIRKIGPASARSHRNGTNLDGMINAMTDPRLA